MGSSVLQNVREAFYMWQPAIIATMLGDDTTYKRLARGLQGKPADHMLRVFRSVSNPQTSDIHSIVAAHKRAKVAAHELDSAWLWMTILPLKAATFRQKGRLLSRSYFEPYMNAAVAHGRQLGVSGELFTMTPSEMNDLMCAHFRNIAKLPSSTRELFWIIIEKLALRQNLTDDKIMSSLCAMLPASFAGLFKP